MGCSCTIDIDHDCRSSWYRDATPRARKPYRCCECGRDIAVGEIYHYAVGMWDGRLDAYHTCADCESVRNNLFCGWLFGSLWEDVTYHTADGGTFSADCIAQLTPRAREVVCEAIEEQWREEEEAEDE